LDVERGNNIKMDRKKVNWDRVDWIDLVYGRGWRCVFVNAEIDFGFLKHNHLWLDSPTWTLACLRSFCQLKYSAIAPSDFVTRVFSRVGLSAPSPIPGYHGRSMISVRVVSHS
jgi:hypothetical protein